MFHDEITIPKGGRSYNAKKIDQPVEKVNVSKSHQIRIQTYELTEKINDEYVFIMQFMIKHTRNVRLGGGLTLHTTLSGERTNNKQKHHDRSSSFFDQIWLQHKSRPYLEGTVNTVIRAFDCDDFIQFNEDRNQFEYKFVATENMNSVTAQIKITKYVSISRSNHSREGARGLLNDRYHQFSKRSIQCVNGREIYANDWDFEIDLTLKPGTHKFRIDEIFEQKPTIIHARNYPRIRKFYLDKDIKTFMKKEGIFELYLTHLSTFESRYKMVEWQKNHIESGPLFELYSILCEIESSDDIWNNLFDICKMDNLNDENICVTEQTVADFIALSLKYYIKDRVKVQNESTMIKLSECDRFILSIILPYFGMSSKSIHKALNSQHLTSGLFNHFIDDYTISRVPPKDLKNELLKHLHAEKFDVVKQYFVAVLQPVSANNDSEQSKWTFYIRPATYSQIFGVNHKINMNAYTFETDNFEFKERGLHKDVMTNLIIKCVDVSFECDWALWTRKLCRNYQQSQGYWKILSSFDNNPRVPVDNLDCILSLLRHEAMNFKHSLLSNKKHFLSVAFLKQKDDPNDLSFTEADVECEYQLTFWNGKKIGNSSLALRLIKAEPPLTGKRAKLMTKDSHYMHYRSNDGDMEWQWYDNDAAMYREYKSGYDIMQQLEASYQGVNEDMFPIQQLEMFRRKTDSGAKERMFNCAQLPTMSNMVVAEKIAGGHRKPFVLRCTFQKHGGGKIINIEQLAINNMYEQFPRNVKRVCLGKHGGIMINDQEQRVSSLGRMNIYPTEKSVTIYWIFEENKHQSIDRAFHYKLRILNSRQVRFRQILDGWRSNTLFDQIMKNRSTEIVASRIWKSDHKMPQIKNITNDKEQIKVCQDLIEPISNGNGHSSVDRKFEKYANYDALLEKGESVKLSENEWNVLDKLDEEQRGIFNLSNTKEPEYKKPDNVEEKLWNLWMDKHAPHKFNERLYKLVSLMFVQSLVSVIRHQIIEYKEKKKEKNKPLIVVISDFHQIYKDFFNLDASNYINKESKSFSFLFDGEGDIKRIDSKGNIYSIQINDFGQKIIANDLFHEFMAMTSLQYMSSLVLFARNENVYVSHNGYISKLSFFDNDEDLHYFFPLFVPLKIGDCVDIEAFSAPDKGTIVSIIEKEEIIYRLRSHENVFYIMNYHKIFNRLQPTNYWKQSKQNVVKWDNVSLKNENEKSMDPSDKSHPFHAIILSLIESSKQSILAIESCLDSEDKKHSILHKLKHSGSLFMFYKTVIAEPKSKDVIEFLSEQQEDEKKQEFEELVESNPNGLSHFVKFLKRNKLICNVQKLNKKVPTSYDKICEIVSNILNESNYSNRVFLCHMIERKKYVLRQKSDEEKAINVDNNNNNNNDEDNGDGDEDNWATEVDEGDEEWLSMENDDDENKKVMEAGPQFEVIIESEFDCFIEYDFTMCCVQNLSSSHLTVEEVMILGNKEDGRLLTQFYQNDIFNVFDLCDKALINKLKQKIISNKTDARDELLATKFTEFIECVPDILEEHKYSQNDLVENERFVICGTETTRNAKMLQTYIESFRRYDEAKEVVFDDGDAEIISSNVDKMLIVAYNPLQTVVITSKQMKDVSHPIHLYRAASDEEFYPKFDAKLNAEWMQTISKTNAKEEKPANIISAISTLLRYNKKYEIILVPSSIHLDRRNFLDSRCQMVAPDHEAIADHRITFLYKGLLYRYDKKKAKEFMKKHKSKKLINEHENNDNFDDDLMEDDEDKIFVDEIKFLLRLLHDNICSELLSDSMDENIEKKNRLRLKSNQRRRASERIFRWLNVGCGSCFLHEQSGRATEIGPSKQNESESAFQLALQQAMFYYYIDCRLPFNEQIIDNEKTCSICYSLIIHPAGIGNDKCPHIFCKLCLEKWHNFVKFEANSPMVKEENQKKCPLCKRNIHKITRKDQDVCRRMRKGIPSIIYEQLLEENESRYLREFLVNEHRNERERQFSENNANGSGNNNDYANAGYQ